MGLKAGDVVILKSGGQALTVAEVNDDIAECVWIGEEGDLFREKLPTSVLELAEIDLSDEDSEHEDSEHEDTEHEDHAEHDHDDEDHEHEDHHETKAAEVA